jgi:hypothetical protein
MSGTSGWRALGSVLFASLAAGALAALLLAAGARWWVPSKLSGPVAEGAWTARSRACFTTDGFYPAELNAGANIHFSWTGRTAHLVFPELDRWQSHRLVLRVTAARPDGVAPPSTLTLSVDGAVVAVAEPRNERQLVPVVIPSRAARGAVVTIDVSDTFVPGPHDDRALGVVVDEVSLRPESGHFSVGGTVALRAALAVALSVAGLWLCGIRGRLGILAAVAVAASSAGLLLQDGAFIGLYATRLVRLGTGVAAIGLLVGVLRWRWPSVAGLAEWPIAVGLVLGVTALELAVFAHPLAQVGDAIFQVHRAQEVRAGQYYFTSITPQPFFEFPYPIALYVVAMPFWRFFTAEHDQVLLLRAVTLAVHALAGLGIYAAVRRQWGDGRGALASAALWMFARAPLEGMSNANLTNVFGQGVFAVAMAGVGWLSAGAASVVPLAGTCVSIFVAFLSHFGTTMVGLPMLGVVSVALMVLGRGHARRAGVWVLVLTLVASAASYVVYYSHFTSLYRQTFERVTSRQSEPPTRSKLVAPPSVKLRQWYAGTGDDYGRPSLPLMATAVAGAVLLARRRPREGLTLVLAGWGFIWLGFTALGVLTPVSMRVNLAAAPVFVCLAACALSALAVRSRLGAAAAIFVAVLIAWDGVRACLGCLGLNSNWPVF